MNNKEHLTEKGINKLLCIVLNITENRVNCMKLLYQLGVRQYATKYKSINYYNKCIIMIQYRIGFIKVQRLVSEFIDNHLTTKTLQFSILLNWRHSLNHFDKKWK